MRMGMLAALLAVAAPAAPTAAQITCRSNVLGAEVCVGVPAPSRRSGEPYKPKGRGLGGVQAPVGAEGGPGLIGAGRTDALGNTFLRAEDLPPERPPLPGVAPPRTCRRDALGNLICR
ncbi:MAG: hypothetical protein H0T41_15745 [Rhodobacteraceae bacterium]|nr:hypothetical protein [Paracoccaceae bacterium]